MLRLISLLLCAVLCAGASAQPVQPAPTPSDAVAGVLDDWHDAAAKADEPRYFAHFSSDAVFMGTDATER
jgi:hypothetical protein